MHRYSSARPPDWPTADRRPTRRPTDLEKKPHGQKKQKNENKNEEKRMNIYKDMEEITGFMAQKRRDDHYHRVVWLYERRKKGEILYNAGSKADPNEVPF